MESHFKQYTDVKYCDAGLRNALRLDCTELVQLMIAKGADVNCRYADDWNTPLHLAIINRCQSSVIKELMSHRLNYGLVNGDDLTACELALRNGFRELGRELIVKEFDGVEDPVDAIYEMLKRNSVEALELLIEVLGLSDFLLVECLSKGWSKLEVMNVAMNPEVKVFVHLTIIRLDYTWSFAGKNNGICQKLQANSQEYTELLVKEIELLLGKYDTGLCHDMSDEFLDLLRVILKNLFTVKNRLGTFPAMQLEYCIAMYLAVFDRKPELDLYQLVINKRLVIDFLKLFIDWSNNQRVDQRMSDELLFKLVIVIHENRFETCKHILEKWKELINSKYTWKELLMIRNKILKSHVLSKISSDRFENITKMQLDLLKIESDCINRMFESRKCKRLYKLLNKTFFKLKQMYSLQKSVHYLSAIKDIELNPVRSCYVEMLTIQRVIQVLGETLKSTKLSPNISTNLRSVLEFVSPGELLKWISKLRQYLSHDYSATKHTLYGRLRNNDTELINFFTRVKADLLKVVPLLGNIFSDHVYRYFKSFLGYALSLKSTEHVQSYAKASRVRLGFKMEHDFQSSDLAEIKRQLAELEKEFNPECHSSNLDVIAKIYSRIDMYVRFLESRSFNFMTEMVLSCIGELLLCDRLVYQKNVAYFYLKSSISPKSGGYGAATFLMQSCNPLIRELLTVEATMPEENSLKRTTMIQNLLKLANVKDIQQLHELTLLNEKSLTSISREICNALVETNVLDDQLKELDRQLQKYYSNLFTIDDKYRIVKQFCKTNKLKYNIAAVAQCRKQDVKNCRKILSDLIIDLTDILSLPESMESPVLVSLLACCEIYENDKTDLFALETLLLEVLEILSSQGVLADNRPMMISYRPVVSGRNLRNYLAHDGLVYETICRNGSPNLTLLLNAACLARYCKVELYSKSTSIITQNPKASVAVENEWSKRLFDLKSKVFKNIENGNYNLLISDDIELKTRDHTGRTVLIALIDHHPEQFIHYLMDKPSKTKLFVEELIKRGLNQEHNFYDDDDFTLSKLVGQQSVRENMAFYLAMKNHCFELENELDMLYGGAYNEDSLHLAIIFRNEKSALSIIDDSRLYSFCQHEAWNFRNTILTFAVLHKLPKVVRRICEVSPELIECTNTSQETPLRIAVATACKENIEILLEFGAQIFTKNKPPIINALQVRKDEILDILLPSDEELLNNESLLHELVVNAGSSGHVKLLERLLPMTKSRSAFVNSLHSAASNNQLRATQMLLDFDRSIVNEQNEFESTALFRACYSGHDMIAKLLLARGADCTVPKKNSPLQCAIDQNRHNQFKMMVQRNISDPDLRNNIIPDLYDLSRYSWIWTALREGVPCSLASDQSVARKAIDNSNLEFLVKLLRSRKELIQQIDTYTMANAIMLGNHKFVKLVITRLDSWNRCDRTRLLNCAVKANDKEMVSLLIDAGCVINSADAYGITPLATAVSVGKPDMVKFLVKLNADPNVESMGNCTSLLDAWNLLSDNIFEQLGGEYYRTYPLLLATMYSFRKIVKYLLKEGALADIRDQSGFTSLVVAMSCGDKELVDMLISHGASVDYVRGFSHSLFKGGSALHFSAIYGYLGMAERMIEEYQFDYVIKDSDGNTALHLAVINDKADFVEYFLNNDNLWNEPNNDGDTPFTLALRQLNPSILNLIKFQRKFEEAVRLFRGTENRTLLHLSVLKGATDVLQMLLREFDINPNWMDQNGNTAVYYAVLKKNYEGVQSLLEAGCSLSGPTGGSSMSAIVVAVLTNQLDLVKLYIQKEKDAIYHLKQHSIDGRNLLISSIMKNNFAMVKLLLKSVDFALNSPYENGYAAIHVAATKRSVRMIDLLLRSGSSIDQINGDGKTALIMAIEHGNYRGAHFLLRKGSSKQIAVDYRYKDTNGMNLLHFVASIGELNSLKFLLDREFFARTVTDAKGKTIGHYAASCKQHAIIEFLIASQFPLDQLDNEGRSSLLCALEKEDLRLAKRLKAVGSSLDVVQEYINKHNFLIKVKNPKLVNFLTDECCIKVGSVIENLLITLTKSTEDRSSSLPKPILPPIIQHILDGDTKLVQKFIDGKSSAAAVRTYRMATRDKETLLHVTARMGYLSILRMLLENEIFHIDVGDVDQTTALQEATMRGQKECVELLLQHGASIDFVDLQNTTALTRACLNSQKDIAELLLNHGADLENTKAFRIVTRNGATALHVAAHGDPSVIELLIRKVGLDVNLTDAGGQTALHIASLIGAIEAVEELIKLGACADVIDNDGKPPFVIALLAGHEAVAARLLSETKNKEYLRSFQMVESLKSVFHLAVEKGFVRLIYQLLNKHGFDGICTDNEGVQPLKSDADLLFKEDSVGQTPLSICLNQSNHEVFAAIIQSSISSGTLKHVISNIKIAYRKEYTKFVDLFNIWLLDYRKNNTEDNQLFTSMISWVYDIDPLLYAIHGDHKDLLNQFLESEVDRSILQDFNSVAWLHVAAVKNLHLLAEVMLDDVNIDVDHLDNHGMTPLCYAVATPHTEAARFLLDRGANVNFQDAAKRTPLQTALETNNKEMVLLLLERHASTALLQEFRYRNDNEHLVQHYIVERGFTEMLSSILPEIDVNHVDKFGMTPLHYAAGCNQLEMIGLLVRAGAEVDCFDVHRTTPLMRALSKNHLEAYRMLVGFGANVDLVRQFRNDNFDGESILHITAEKNRFAAAKLLVEELECDVDCVDNDGNTPLHCAVQKGCFEVVKYLLGKNADIHLKNKSDRTVLQLLEEVNFDVYAYKTNECE